MPKEPPRRIFDEPRLSRREFDRAVTKLRRRRGDAKRSASEATASAVGLIRIRIRDAKSRHPE